MAQTLPQDAVEERLRWITPYLEKKRSLTEIADMSPFSYRTLKRWVADYRRSGVAGLIPRSRRPHTHARAYPPSTIKAVRRLRIKTHLGPDVLAHLLKREGIVASHSGIGKLLKREGLSRARKRIPKKDTWEPRATAPGELLEVDVAFVKKFKGKWLYQFNAVDSCTRWRHVWVTSEQSNRTAVLFLQAVIAKAPFSIKGIKTDNGTIFTNRYTGYAKSANPEKPRLHAFDRACQEHDITHYLIAPGKPQQNGKVERSHRTDRERFWRRVRFETLPELVKKHAAYLRWYNQTCPHLALNGLTPLEKLATIQGTNVRV